jgi:hypothetical protein
VNLFGWWRTPDPPRPESDQRVDEAEARTDNIVARAERVLASLTTYREDHLSRAFLEGRHRDP